MMHYVRFAFLFVQTLILIISNFGFDGGTLGLIASVPFHCFPFFGCWFTKEYILSCYMY